ncbi:MAG: polysaccharide deacetylase family protein [Alphaproteobacteria bacterium]|nr:polysaccharide deacetylase family protein [Alphaproteobacteria bacterium]
MSPWPGVAARGADLPEDRSAAIAFVYHRVGEDAYPESNLSLSAFEEQVREILNGGYTVLALPDVIAALQANTALPPNSIILTFEGGYRSAYVNAMPLLIEKKIPFTVFFASNLAEQDISDYMNWQDLQKLQRLPFVSFGLHPANNAPMAELNIAEAHDQITRARVATRKHLNINPDLFAYPGGKITATARKAVANNGFKAAFGLHSGAVYADADLWALPRFSLTDRYGDLERFQLAAHALPLPVSDLEPAEPIFNADTKALGFTLPKSLAERSKQMTCFASDNVKTKTQVIGQRVEIRLNQAAQDEPRIRINCTLPEPAHAEGESPRWRWLGMLLFNTGLSGNAESDLASNPQQGLLP